MQLYVVGLVNVFIVSLVVVSIRSVAAYRVESNKSEVVRFPVLLELVRLQLKVFSFLVFGLSFFVCAIFIGKWQTNPGLVLSSSLLSLGLMVRGVGLITTSYKVGCGEVGADKLFAFIFSIVFFGISCGAVYFFNAGSEIIAAIYLSVALVLTVYQIRCSWGRAEIASFNNKYIINFWSVFRSISTLEKQYFKFVLMSVGGFLTMNGDVFIVATLWGASALAHYSIAAKIGVGIFSMAVVYPSMRLQPMALAFSHENKVLSRSLWIECLVVALIVGILFSIVSILIYPYLISWIFLDKSSVPTVLFVGICINSVITSFTGANGWPIIATGQNDLLVPTWLNGMLLIVLGFVGGYWFGIPGLLVGVGSAHTVSSVLHFGIAKKLFPLNL